MNSLYTLSARKNDKPICVLQYRPLRYQVTGFSFTFAGFSFTRLWDRTVRQCILSVMQYIPHDILHSPYRLDLLSAVASTTCYRWRSPGGHSWPLTLSNSMLHYFLVCVKSNKLATPTLPFSHLLFTATYSRQTNPTYRHLRPLVQCTAPLEVRLRSLMFLTTISSMTGSWPFDPYWGHNEVIRWSRQQLCDSLAPLYMHLYSFICLANQPENNPRLFSSLTTFVLNSVVVHDL